MMLYCISPIILSPYWSYCISMKPPWKSPWKSPWESPNGDPLGVWPCPGYFQWGVHQTEHREVGGDSRRGKLGKPGKGAGAQRSLKKWVKKSPGEWHIIYLSINKYIYIYHYIYHYIYRDIIIYIYRYIIIYIYIYIPPGEWNMPPKNLMKSYMNYGFF